MFVQPESRMTVAQRQVAPSLKIRLSMYRSTAPGRNDSAGMNRVARRFDHDVLRRLHERLHPVGLRRQSGAGAPYDRLPDAGFREYVSPSVSGGSGSADLADRLRLVKAEPCDGLAGPWRIMRRAGVEGSFFHGAGRSGTAPARGAPGYPSTIVPALRVFSACYVAKRRAAGTSTCSRRAI